MAKSTAERLEIIDLGEKCILHIPETGDVAVVSQEELLGACATATAFLAENPDGTIYFA